LPRPATPGRRRPLGPRLPGVDRAGHRGGVDGGGAPHRPDGGRHPGGSMAAEIDGRSLETVPADAGPLARAAAAVGAAVWAHPPALMALAAADRRVDESVSRDLAECCGRIVFGAEVTEPGVGVVAGEGV